MAAAEDTYSPAEAAALLDVSERRIRQLAAAGTLEVIGEHPLRLAALSVLAERERRGITTVRRASDTAVATDVEGIRGLVAAIVGEILPLALEGRDRVEDVLKTALAESRAEAMQLRAETAQLRAELEAVERRKAAKKGRKTKGKKAGKGWRKR